MIITSQLTDTYLILYTSNIPVQILIIHCRGICTFMVDSFVVCFEQNIHNNAGDRIVSVGGTECPCGGTHVKNVTDIRGITITKIKKVYYLVSLYNNYYVSYTVNFSEQEKHQSFLHYYGRLKNV